MSLDSWHLKQDVVSLGSLRLAVQRIAYSHWNPSETLRSWGRVPLHRETDVLLVPSAPAEALWLGVWLEDSDGPANVALTDPISGYNASAKPPRDYQIGVLRRKDSEDRPISLATDNPYQLRLELVSIEKRATISLLLVKPIEWSHRAGREAPEPLDQPPSLPPLLG